MREIVQQWAVVIRQAGHAGEQAWSRHDTRKAAERAAARLFVERGVIGVRVQYDPRPHTPPPRHGRGRA